MERRPPSGGRRRTPNSESLIGTQPTTWGVESAKLGGAGEEAFLGGEDEPVTARGARQATAGGEGASRAAPAKRVAPKAKSRDGGAVQAMSGLGEALQALSGGQGTTPEPS